MYDPSKAPQRATQLLTSRSASSDRFPFCRKSDGSRDDPDPTRLDVSVSTRDPEEPPLPNATLQVGVLDTHEVGDAPDLGQQLAIPDVPGQVAAMAVVDDPAEIRAVASKAKAVADFYRRECGRASEQHQRDACFELTAARRLGTVLQASAPHGGDRRSRSASSTLKIEGLGISKTQSSMYRAISRTTDAAWIEYLDSTAEEGAPISAVAASRWARAMAGSDESQEPADQPRPQRRQGAERYDNIEHDGAAASGAAPQASRAPNHDPDTSASPTGAKGAPKRRTAFEKFPFPRGPRARQVALRRVSDFLIVFVHCSKSPEWHEQVRALLQEAERRIPLPPVSTPDTMPVSSEGGVGA